MPLESWQTGRSLASVLNASSILGALTQVVSGVQRKAVDPQSPGVVSAQTQTTVWTPATAIATAMSHRTCRAPRVTPITSGMTVAISAMDQPSGVFADSWVSGTEQSRNSVCVSVTTTAPRQPRVSVETSQIAIDRSREAGPVSSIALPCHDQVNPVT